MLIVCPNCATSYDVKAASLGPAGRSVRCIRCGHLWFAANTAALAAIAQAHRADLAAISGSASGDGIAGPTDASWESPPSPGPVASDPANPAVASAQAAKPGQIMEQPASADDTAWPVPEQEQPGLDSQIPIADAPPLAPTDPQPDALPADPGPGEDIETVAARRAALETGRGRYRWPLSQWPTTVLMLVVANAALIGWRTDVARWVPQTASLYAAIGLPVNLRGLTFINITAGKEINDGVQVLVVEGAMVNTTARVADVPRLRFAVRNAHGHEIYTWTALPARNALAPGATLAFRSRLASPPPEAHDVLVRFFNRRDLIDSSE